MSQFDINGRPVTKNKINFIFIAVWFYLGWFGCVFFASEEHSILTLLFPLILITFLFFRRLLSIRLFVLSTLFSIVGIAFDSQLIRFDFVQVVGETSMFIPIWLVSIWLLFSFSMTQLGSWWRIPIWLGSILGFIFGPFSYKSGELLQVLFFNGDTGLFVYAIFWALMFPSVLYFTRRYS